MNDYRLLLLRISKSFILPPLDYGDIIYDQAYTASFHQKIESVQYNLMLAITGAISQLDLKSLEKRNWGKKLCCLFKILRNQSLKYLFNVMPTSGSHKTQEMLTIFLSSK